MHIIITLHFVSVNSKTHDNYSLCCMLYSLCICKGVQLPNTLTIHQFTPSSDRDYQGCQPIMPFLRESSTLITDLKKYMLYYLLQGFPKTNSLIHKNGADVEASKTRLDEHLIALSAHWLFPKGEAAMTFLSGSAQSDYFCGLYGSAQVSCEQIHHLIQKGSKLH